MIGVGSLVVTSSKNIFELKSIHDNETDLLDDGTVVDSFDGILISLLVPNDITV
jgi:hypothetical protein